MYQDDKMALPNIPRIDFDKLLDEALNEVLKESVDEAALNKAKDHDPSKWVVEEFPQNIKDAARKILDAVMEFTKAMLTLTGEGIHARDDSSSTFAQFLGYTLIGIHSDLLKDAKALCGLLEQQQSSIGEFQKNWSDEELDDNLKVAKEKAILELLSRISKITERFKG